MQLFAMDKRIFSARKVLIITHQLTRTGAPLVLLDTIKMLRSHGYYLDVISLSDGILRDELEKMGISVRIQRRFLPVWKEFFTEAKGYDCVICNTLLTFEVIHILNLTDIPTIWWIHEPKEYFDMYKDMLPDLSALRSNIHMLAVSPVNRDIVKDLYGVDIPVMTIGVQDRYQKLHEKVMHDRIRFLCVGLYSYTKGQDVLASAITKLSKEALAKSEFIFCGDEKNADKDYLDDIVRLSKAFLNVSALDAMPHDSLMAEMRRADYVVAPSRLDSLPTVAIEGMMLGVPVILSDACGVARYLNGEGGLVFPSEDVDSLRDTIENAISIREDTGRYDALVKSARKCYELNFNESIIEEELLSLINDITRVPKIIFILDTLDILDQFSVNLIKTFRKMGYEVYEFRRDKFRESIQGLGDFLSTGRVKAVLNYNFYSAFMEYKNGENFWKHFNVPIITMLMDHPFCFEGAFEMLPGNSVVLCPDRNHMNYVLRFYPNISTAGFLPHGGEISSTPIKPVSERSIDVLYTGGISRPNAYKIMPDFGKYDFDARGIGNEAYDFLIKNPDNTTEYALEKVLKEKGIVLSDEELSRFIADMHYVDLLAVSYYREKTIRILADAGITVRLYGFGWDALDWINGSNVDYRGRVSAYDIPALMADSRIVLSTMTWFKDGTHDRVFNGMLQGAVAVTDTSVYMEEEFKGIYAGGDYSAADAELGFFRLSEIEKLPDMVRYLLDDPGRMQQLADAGYKKALAGHTWEKRAMELDRDLLQFM